MGRGMRGVLWSRRRGGSSHDGAAALFVTLDILDLEGDTGSLGKGFVDAAILHGRAFCATVSQSCHLTLCFVDQTYQDIWAPWSSRLRRDRACSQSWDVWVRLILRHRSPALASRTSKQRGRAWHQGSSRQSQQPILTRRFQASLANRPIIGLLVEASWACFSTWTGIAYAETKHDGVGIIVGKRAQSVEFFLSGRVPEGEFYMYVVDEDVVNVVFWVALVLRRIKDCSRGGTKDGGFATRGKSG